MRITGEIVYGSYYLECNAKDFCRIRESVISWAVKHGYKLGLSSYDDAKEFFEKLGLGDGVDMDEKDGLTLDGNLDCSKICYPYIQLLQILAPYVANEDIGLIVTDEDGTLEIKNNDGKIKVSLGDLD